MSQDPKSSKAPPAAVPAETLEDAVYKASLSENNKALRGTNPLIAVPTTLVTYTCVALLTFFVATKTEAGKAALKSTIGVDLTDDMDKEEEPPPPPPPPAPAAAAAPPVKIEVKDAPPPPPITDQEAIPDAAPKEIPKIDYSASYAARPGEVGGTGIGVIGGAGSGSGSAVGNVAGAASSVTVHDVTAHEIRETYRPPQPPYPPMAKAARIAGSVLVEFTVGTDGVPTDVKVIEGHQLLHTFAMDYARKWRFHPYMIDGHPVPARFRIRMNFRM